MAGAGLASSQILLGTAPAWAQAAHDHTAAAASVNWGAVVVRCVVLVTTALVGGVALLRPFTGPATPARRSLITLAAFAAAAGALASVSLNQVPLWLAATQAACTVAVPFTLRRSRPAVVGGLVLTVGLAIEAVAGRGGFAYAAGIAHAVAASVWVGAVAAVATEEAGNRRTLLRRLTPIAVVAGVLVAATGVVQAWLDGLRVDSTTFGSTFGQVVLIKAVLLVGVAVLGLLAYRAAAREHGTGPRAGWPVRLTRISAVGLAGALLAGGALAAIELPPAPPVPGAPLLRSVALADQVIPIAVVPQRPGLNLVHVGGTDVTVGVDRQHLVPATPRPGSTGGWSLLALPVGPSTLWVQQGGRLASLRVDTGQGGAQVASIAGPDGPECASAVLGSLAAGKDTMPQSCPADRLTEADGSSLRALVGFLAGRGIHTLTLAQDSSPRSVAASDVVRAAAARHQVEIAPAPQPDSALVVLAGWSAADPTLQGVARGEIPGVGTYLAPWLANGQLLAYSSGAVIALRFDPHEPQPLRYLHDVHARVAGETASAAGYEGWLAAQGDSATGHTNLYAAATVSFLPAELGHAHGSQGGWLPGGSITKVTPPIDD